ncbi:hypothetical protein ACFQ7A_09210 [Streptomyces sp. NPDC056528]|uniref:hypothetical protein n=1 Tax=Streptomyces sp. NPDC056528 TaxID=3345854 RepID=UPI0036CE031B
MSASEKSSENQSGGNSSRPASDGTGNGGAASRGTAAEKKTVQSAKSTGEAAGGTLSALPAPLAEKTLAAVHAVRGTGGLVLTAVRTRKTLTGGTAVSAAAALTGAYALGRRAGLRSRGPLSRLTGGRI